VNDADRQILKIFLKIIIIWDFNLKTGENKYGLCRVLFVAGLQLWDFKKIGLRLQVPTLGYNPDCWDSDSAPLQKSV